MRDVHFEKMNGLKIPLVAAWRNGNAPMNSATEWLKSERDALGAKLLENGAILFRGFPISGEDDFQALVDGLGGCQQSYIGGITPRHRVKGNVYTSTEITRIYQIKLHQEMSYQRAYPDQVCFYCQKPAATGGETFIADIRDVQCNIPAPILEKFRRRGIRYTQLLHNKSIRYREFVKRHLSVYLHLAWQDTFDTWDRSKVEAECAKREFEFNWRRNGDLEIHTILPAFVTHPRTGQEVWFNQASTFHFNKRALSSPYNLAYYIRRLTYPKVSNMPFQVAYGDGSPISFDELEPVYDAIDRHSVAFPWQARDVLWIDNRLVGHGRNPFSGERRVLVSLLKN